MSMRTASWNGATMSATTSDVTFVISFLVPAGAEVDARAAGDTFKIFKQGEKQRQSLQ
jgi:hypothetical protein